MKDPNFDLEAIKKIRDILSEFNEDGRVLILEYCLMVAKKDNEL